MCLSLRRLEQHKVGLNIAITPTYNKILAKNIQTIYFTHWSRKWSQTWQHPFWRPPRGPQMFRWLIFTLFGQRFCMSCIYFVSMSNSIRCTSVCRLCYILIRLGLTHLIHPSAIFMYVDLQVLIPVWFILLQVLHLCVFWTMLQYSPGDTKFRNSVSEGVPRVRG